MECVFCKIIQGEAEASFVFKGKAVSAFMDIGALNKGHILIVPNRHVERVAGLDSSELEGMFALAQRVVVALEKSSIKCEATNIFISDGEVAGQEVPHCHLHVVPRYVGDGYTPGFLQGGRREVPTRAELESVARKVSSLIG